jgi:2',3'-cyclic-nucleotide 2'-phosphodiesterase (5'-nucleotidase family)
MGDLIGVLPFENNLFVVRLTGKQLKEQLAIDGPVVAGITWSYREGKDGKRSVLSVIDRKGKPIDDGKKYRVVINDFMYYGGDGFTFKTVDPTPEDTGLSWRQPVIRAFNLAESMNRKVEPVTGPRARTVR